MIFLIDVEMQICFSLEEQIDPYSSTLFSWIPCREEMLVNIGSELESLVSDVAAISPTLFHILIDTLLICGSALRANDDTSAMLGNSIRSLTEFLEGSSGTSDQRSFALYLLELSAANWTAESSL